MKTDIVHRAVNKTLTLLLCASILGVGYEAVKLTHVTARVTVTFGEPDSQKFAVADALDMAQMIPMPTHKPTTKGN